MPGAPSIRSGRLVPRLTAPFVAHADRVWSALSVLTVVDLLAHATGNGSTDDTSGIVAAINALPAGGGVIWMAPGTSFRKTAAIEVAKAHVKFWAPNGQSEIYANSGNTSDAQALRSIGDGFGVFGLRYRGNASARGGSIDDHGIVADQITQFEAVGCEVSGTYGTGIFTFGGQEIYEEGNYVHHTWADHFHHTFGARNVWAWDNWIRNNGPSDGDDGIACVGYGGEDLPGNMEWWNNRHLGSGSGRGFSVIGGEYVSIHDNYAVGVAGAGIIIATEPAYTSLGVSQVTVQRNWITECCHAIGHPGILIAGDYAPAGPIGPVTLLDNVSAGNTGGYNYDTQGSLGSITNTNLSQVLGDLPTKPVLGDVTKKSTTVLATRDVSFVSAGQQPGLYRIHVRKNPSASGFQQRFEYVVKGTPADVWAWTTTLSAAWHYVCDQRVVSGTAYALVLCHTPVSLGTGVSAVTHAELRLGDQIGANPLAWLWARINAGAY